MTTKPLTSSFWRNPIGRWSGVAALTCVAIVFLLIVVIEPLWSIVVFAVGVAGVYGLRVVGRIERRNAARREYVDAELAPVLVGSRQAYAQLVNAHFNRIDLAGSDAETAVKLTDVYVDVGIKRSDESETAERPFVGTDHKTDKRQPFLSLLRKRSTGILAIVGESGSGKSTTLRRTAIQLCRERRGRRRIPILLDLADHPAILADSNPPSVASEISRTRWIKQQLPASWFERQLSAGRCVVMLDGWDSIANDSDRKKATAWIREQAQLYPRSNFLVTTRSAGSASHAVPADSIWQLRRLTGMQIASLVYAWCEVVENRKAGHSESWKRDEAAAEAGVLMSRLRANKVLHELAGTPLLLSLIVMVHRRCGILPGTRAGLYGDAMELFLERQSGSTMNIAQRYEAAQWIARGLMNRKTFHITRETAAESLPGADVDAFIAEAVESGWLMPTTTGDYRFTHANLQYYMAACQLYHSGDSTAVTTKINDPWWRDTILLWSTFTNATRVVEACLQSKTIAALALAFDIAEESNVDASVRTQLKEQLTRATQTLAENRLMGAVKASQETRDMVRLYGGTRLTAKPVSNRLYCAYLDSVYSSGGRRGIDADEREPMRGMWAADAAGFVNWLNDLPRNDDTMYWLPTSAELAEPQCDLSKIAPGRNIWLQDEPRPTLQLSRGAKGPFTVDHNWWLNVAAADRHRMTLLMYQLATVLGPMARPLSRDLAGEMDLDRTIALELPRDLKRDPKLSASRQFLRGHDLSPAGEDVTDPRAREHIARMIEYVEELAAKSLDFRRDPQQSAHADLPFAFLERLTDRQRRDLATAGALLWFASRPARGRVDYGLAVGVFDEFVTRGIFDADVNHSQTVAPHSIAKAAEDAYAVLRGRFKDDENTTVWMDMAMDTLADTLGRLSAALTHSHAHTVDELACLRIALIGVAGAVREHARTRNKDMLTLRPCVTHLSTAIAGLSVLEYRAGGVIEPNEVLLLVRK